MKKDTVERTRLDAATEARLMEAIEAFFETKRCDVLCDVCESPIEFRQLAANAWEHRCDCGKFSGTLRGL